MLMCQPAPAGGVAVNLRRTIRYIRSRALDRSTRARGDWTFFETETPSRRALASRAATPLSPGAAMGSEITASPTPPGLSPPTESELPICKTWEGNDVRPPTPRFDHDASTRSRSTLPSRATPCPTPPAFLTPPRASLFLIPQRFFCDGRCMTGPSPRNLAGTAAIVLVPSIIFNALVVPDVANAYSVAILAIAILWPLWCVGNLLSAGTTDPGILPRLPRPPRRRTAASARGTSRRHFRTASP